MRRAIRNLDKAREDLRDIARAASTLSSARNGYTRLDIESALRRALDALAQVEAEIRSESYRTGVEL